MVETIEYSLVVLTSILFAGSGVYLFTNYTQRVSQTDASATFSSILSAAYSSLASNSERRVVLFLSNATISCQGGTVVFESAYFRPASVRRTSKRLNLKTEASTRFERGADIGAQVIAI